MSSRQILSATALAPRYRAGKTWLIAIAAGCLSLCLLGLILFVGCLTTSWGTAQLARLAVPLTGGAVQIRGVEGPLVSLFQSTSTLRIAALQYRTSAQQWRAEHVEVQWEPFQLFNHSVAIRRLQVRRLTGQSLKTCCQPLEWQAPATLRLPFKLRVAKASFAAIQWDANAWGSAQLQWQSDAQTHRFRLLNWQARWGQARALFQVRTTAPFRVVGRLQLSNKALDSFPHAPRLEAQLGGSLMRLRLTGSLRQPDQKTDQKTSFQAALTLFKLFNGASADGVPRLSVQTEVFDPSQINANWPRARLALQAALTGTTSARMRLRFSLQNHQPAPWSQRGLPIEKAVGALLFSPEKIQLEALQLSHSGARLEVTGQRLADLWTLKAAVSKLNLQQLHEDLPRSAFTGPLEMSGPSASPTVWLRWQDAQHRIESQFSVPIAQHISPNRARQLSVRYFTLKAGEAQLSLSGSVGLSPEFPFNVQGQLYQFNPSVWWRPLPSARLNARIVAQGEAKNQHAQLYASLENSRWRGHLLSGKVAFDIRRTRLQNIEVALTVADNTLTANGAFGQPGDTLYAELKAHRLGQLADTLDGRLALQLQAAGSWQQPMFSTTFSGQTVRIGGRVFAEQLEGKAQLRPSPQSPFQLQLELKNAQVDTLQIGKLSLFSQGTRRQHTIKAVLQAALRSAVEPLRFDTTALLNGDLDGRLAWRGQLLSFSEKGSVSVHLEKPAALTVDRVGARLGNVHVQVLGSATVIEDLTVNFANGLQSRGVFERLPLSKLLALAPYWPVKVVDQRLKNVTDAQAIEGTIDDHLRKGRVHRAIGGPAGLGSRHSDANAQGLSTTAAKKTDVLLSGHWALQLLGDGLKGVVVVRRVRGDVWVPPNGRLYRAMGLRAFQARLELDGTHAVLDASMSSGAAEANGILRFSLKRLPEGWTVDKSAAVSGDASIHIHSLSRLPLRVSAAIDGQLEAKLRVNGTLAEPEWSGKVYAKQWRIEDQDAGIALTEGSWSAELLNQQLNVQQLNFISAKGGRLTGAGAISLSAESPKGQLDFQLERFALVKRFDQELIVSGRTQLQWRERQLQLSGTLSVDEGFLDFSRPSGRVLSKDIHIVGTEGRLTQSETQTSWPVKMAIEFDLGKAFKLQAPGIEAQLSGHGRLEALPGKTLTAVGQVHIDRGNYTVYGQKLTVERGSLFFAGPIDDPALNIIARRKNSPVGAGIQLIGTLKDSRLTVIGNSGLSEQEKLSWLVTGHASRDDAGLGPQPWSLAGALTASQLNQKVRLLDDLDIVSKMGAPSTSTATKPLEQFVSLGKQLSEQVYLGYEYGLSSTHQAIKLTYRFLQSISFILTAGNTSAVELRYTKRFDGEANTSP